MSRRALVGAAFAAALTTPLALAGTAGASPAPTASAHRSARVCAVASPGYAACSALVRVNAKGQPAVTPGPSGYGPADLQSAYNLPSSTAGAGQTIAIVDAYNDPNAESDLGVYRSQYGLSACTTANGCFKRSTRTASRAATPGMTPAGPRRSPSTWTWPRRSAPTARFCWWRPRRRPSRTSVRR